MSPCGIHVLPPETKLAGGRRCPCCVALLDEERQRPGLSERARIAQSRHNPKTHKRGRHPFGRPTKVVGR